MTRGTRAWRVVLFATLVVASWVLLVPSPPEVGEGLPHVDKLQHAILFAGLALVARRAYPAHAPWTLFAALVAYGAAIEIAQGRTGRSFEILDLAADALGAVVCFLPAAGPRAADGVAPRHQQR